MNKKNKVILISVVLGVLVIGLIVGANITGKAVSYTVVDLGCSIEARGYSGWRDCSQQGASRADLDNWCRSQTDHRGNYYSGLIPGRACLHSWEPARSLVMFRDEEVEGRTETNLYCGGPGIGPGYALTAVLCQSGGSTSSGSTSSGTNQVTTEKFCCVRDGGYEWQPFSSAQGKWHMGTRCSPQTCDSYCRSAGYVSGELNCAGHSDCRDASIGTCDNWRNCVCTG